MDSAALFFATWILLPRSQRTGFPCEVRASFVFGDAPTPAILLRGFGKKKQMFFCILCRGEIDPARARRGGVTCSETCQKEYRRLKRQESAQRKCRLCGRRFRRSLKLDPVLKAHSGILETV